jgi:small subunit ribosomal protein SAe
MSSAFANLPEVLQPREEDIQMMLSAGVHTGTRNSDSNMRPYIWRRRNDGLHILNIGKTWEKLVLAARVIAAVENPEDVIAISARPYGMRATLKYGEFNYADDNSERAAMVLLLYTPSSLCTSSHLTAECSSLSLSLSFIPTHSLSLT